MVIMGVLAAAAAPSFNSLTSTSAAVTHRDALALLTFARERAITTGVRTWVVIDLQAQTTSVLVENPDAPGRAGARALTDPATNAPAALRFDSDRARGTRIVSVALNNGSEVGFDGLGRPLDASAAPLIGGALRLTGNVAVFIEPETGAVSLGVW